LKEKNPLPKNNVKSLSSSLKDIICLLRSFIIRGMKIPISICQQNKTYCNWGELSELIILEIDQLLLVPLVNQGFLKMEAYKKVEEIQEAIRQIAKQADNFERWKMGNLPNDLVN
jgi:hypothetical protein